MTRSIGFIAEDISDVEVLKILITKISKKTFTSAHFVGKGCGPIKKKIPGWSKAFIHKGVNHLLVVHDLDRNNEKSLRTSLENLVNATTFQTKAVVIPKEELEAWLLSDENAIFSALKLETTPKNINHPETINSPKEHLQELVQKNSKGGHKQYVNTVHNKAIAEMMDISKLKKCPSFDGLNNFVLAVLK